eukprot:evm.model.NODE_20417_length_10763_cov_21.298616.3
MFGWGKKKVQAPEPEKPVVPRLDLSQPRWDQSTFEGRARHFFTTTNPLNGLASDAELDHAKALLEQYKAGKEPAGTTDEQIWEAKHLYDSAFHPETGEKLFLPGRMSFQEATIKLSQVEPELQENAKKMTPVPEVFFYNKGL